MFEVILIVLLSIGAALGGGVFVYHLASFGERKRIMRKIDAVIATKRIDSSIFSGK